MKTKFKRTTFSIWNRNLCHIIIVCTVTFKQFIASLLHPFFNFTDSELLNRSVNVDLAQSSFVMMLHIFYCLIWYSCKVTFTLCQGLCRVSRRSRAGACLRKTFMSSLIRVNWFQRRSSSMSWPSPCKPSREEIWLKLASRYSRFG